MKTTINQEAILLSKKGMKELKRTILQLERDRQKVLSSLRELDKVGSRDEHLARIERMSNLESIEDELVEKKQILLNAKLLPIRQTALQVAIGSVVDLIDKHGQFFRFKIVNSIEANPSDGRISTESPLGHSLLGRTVQDIVELDGNGAANQFQLLKIT